MAYTIAQLASAAFAGKSPSLDSLLIQKPPAKVISAKDKDRASKFKAAIDKKLKNRKLKPEPKKGRKRGG